MSPSVIDTVDMLRREIILRQVHKPAQGAVGQILTGPIAEAFPSGDFTVGAVHEFLFNTSEDRTASFGYTTTICAKLMRSSGIGVWIGMAEIFPHALASFGVDPANSLFIRVAREKQILQATEMVLQSDGVASVVSEVNEFDFTQSRRLQLATEHSKVTALLLRRNPKNLSTASVSRWRVRPIPSSASDLPGLSFPRWNIELLRVRNGKPGEWKVEYRNNELNYITTGQEQRIEQPLKKVI